MIALRSTRCSSSSTRTRRLAVELYYREELTQTEIADRLGCSQMQISRIIRGALVQLQATPDAGASARLDAAA